MIVLLNGGNYKLIETRHHTKVLYLDNHTYAWVEPRTDNEILVLSHKRHKTDCILSAGRYCLYDVFDEPKISDHKHLELEVGDNLWQGYILLTGLPTEAKKRTRIIPSTELITNNPNLHGRKFHAARV